MNGKKKNVEYLSPEKLVSAITTNYGDKDIEELLDVEAKLRKIKHERAVRERQQGKNVVCEVHDIAPLFPIPARSSWIPKDCIWELEEQQAKRVVCHGYRYR